MDIKIKVSGKSSIVSINADRIDAAKAPELKGKLFEIIESGSTYLLIDMSEVRFIDSSGLGVLVTALKKIGQNGSMVLCGLNREVKALFELTQLFKVFEIFENNEDALQTLEKHAE